MAETMIETKPQRKRGEGRIWRRGGILWIQYYDESGRQRRESTRSGTLQVAERLLKRRLAEREAGLLPAPRTERVLVAELADAYLLDYRARTIPHEKSSNPDAEYLSRRAKKLMDETERRWVKHLRGFFGGIRASRVSTEDLNRYIEHRKAEGASNATVNRELALLHRIFTLARKHTPPKVSQVPVFPERLPESQPRTGFVGEKEYERLRLHCSELWLRALLATAYDFGFRKGELLNMRVRQLDLLERTIRLNPGTTKNREGRTVKMTEEVYLLLAECVRGKALDGYVFTRPDGQPVRDFREAWARLCCAADLGQLVCAECSKPIGNGLECADCSKGGSSPALRYTGLLFHDLRRSAVRNMVRRGVPERVAMAISGHKTRSVFERYNIVSESDLAEAARRIENGAKTGTSAQTEHEEQVAQPKQLLV